MSSSEQPTSRIIEDEVMPYFFGHTGTPCGGAGEDQSSIASSICAFAYVQESVVWELENEFILPVFSSYRLAKCDISL